MSSTDVEWVLQARLVPARVHSFSPISAWLLGLSRNRLLNRADVSERPVSGATPVLLAFRGVFAIAFLLTLASFFRPSLEPTRPLLALITVAVAAVATGASVWTARRRRMVPVPSTSDRRSASEDGSLWLPDLPLDLAFGAPEFLVVVLVVALLAVLAAFVFFLIWLPVLFLVVSLITLGAWWRVHRAAFVTANADRRIELRGAGEDLLRRGAILSKTWDAHLGVSFVRTAIERRKAYAMARTFFVLLGIASLALAVVFVCERFVPSDRWPLAIAPTAGVVLFLFAALLSAIYWMRSLGMRG